MVAAGLEIDEVAVRFVAFDYEEAGGVDLLRIDGGNRLLLPVAEHGSNLACNSNYCFARMASGGASGKFDEFPYTVEKCRVHPVNNTRRGQDVLNWA